MQSVNIVSPKFFGCNKGCKSRNLLIYTLVCGEKGIRTLGTPKSTTVFETAPFDHSGISPISHSFPQTDAKV